MKKRMLMWMLGTCLGMSLSVGMTACGRTEAVTDPAGMETLAEAVSEPEETKVPETEDMVDIPAYGADGDRAVVSETAAADILLTSAPELSLTDPLSSTLNQFVVQSGNYEWTVMERGETQSMVACGMHPLDSLAESNDKLKVPHYNRMDTVLFTVSAVIQPDHLLVSQWDDSALGMTETEAEECLEYDDTGMIELRPGKVYEVTATWSEEHLEKRGFWGTASYSFITE